MPNKMLIDATHPEETRVVVVRGNRVEEFDFETAQRKQLRGNIYLAKVTRVEPSLQAAFVEYGGNRHGFLAFSEIHPDYYQIPVADRQALIEAEEQAQREAEQESEDRASHRRRSRQRSARRRSGDEHVQSEVLEHAEADATPAESAGQDHNHPHELEHSQTGTAGEHQVETADREDREHESHEEHQNDHAGERAQDVQQPPLFAAEQPMVAAETPVGTAVEASAAAGQALSAGDLETSADDERTEQESAQENVAHADDGPHGDAGVEHTTEGEADAAGSGEATDVEEGDEAEEEEEDIVESVGGDDVLEEVPERPYRPRRQYKIQEVIKRRQVMLVQVVKEERGNKGAALTTYLSLAGRYAVLMPNTARGGGISRKITSAQDRSRLKEVVQDLDVPEGMGIILRTAGASRTQQEIKRDFEYLIRMWETVRDTTLKSQAPTLVYEEGSLIKRSLRDLYNKEIDEILVAGDAGYREAHDFMKMLMPSNVRVVKQYRDGQPLFSRMGVESQLDAMFSPTVQLKSGGYVVINQTEALVSIDVNSGRATREHHIEDTALKTNLEAAEEVARQLRLRDLAGLIVIDFIDMDEKRNNRAVERKLSDCLRQDRARIQVGRISHFGLLEMSRQRIRASVLESSTEPCPQCGGTGHVRSVSSVALQLLRGIEEILMKGATHNLVVRTRTDVALYVLNHKRGHLRDLENGFKVSLSVVADPAVSGLQSYVIDRGEQVHTLEAAKALLTVHTAAIPPAQVEDSDDELDAELESEVETEETLGLSEDSHADAGEIEGEQEGQGHRRRRRRRRRGRGVSEGREATQTRDEHEDGHVEPSLAPEAQPDDGDQDGEETDEQPSFIRGDNQGGGERRPRRRGRRGGRRRRGAGGIDDGLVGSIADELAPAQAPEATAAVADFEGGLPDGTASHPEREPEPPAAEPQPVEHAATDAHANTAPSPESAAEPEKPAARRSTVRERVSLTGPSTEMPVAHTTPAPPSVAAEPAPETPSEDRPRRAGWWSRRFGNNR